MRPPPRGGCPPPGIRPPSRTRGVRWSGGAIPPGRGPRMALITTPPLALSGSGLQLVVVANRRRPEGQILAYGAERALQGPRGQYKIIPAQLHCLHARRRLRTWQARKEADAAGHPGHLLLEGVRAGEGVPRPGQGGGPGCPAGRHPDRNDSRNGCVLHRGSGRNGLGVYGGTPTGGAPRRGVAPDRQEALLLPLLAGGRLQPCGGAADMRLQGFGGGSACRRPAAARQVGRADHPALPRRRRPHTRPGGRRRVGRRGSGRASGTGRGLLQRGRS